MTDISSKFLEHLDLIKSLYPSELKELASDKEYLSKWVEDMIIFETRKTSSNPILEDSCYRKLLEIIQRRHNIVEKPEDASNQFDSGRERKQREDALNNIKKLSGTIIGFYDKEAPAQLYKDTEAGLESKTSNRPSDDDLTEEFPAEEYEEELLALDDFDEFD